MLRKLMQLWRALVALLVRRGQPATVPAAPARAAQAAPSAPPALRGRIVRLADRSYFVAANGVWWRVQARYPELLVGRRFLHYADERHGRVLIARERLI